MSFKTWLMTAALSTMAVASIAEAQNIPARQPNPPRFDDHRGPGPGRPPMRPPMRPGQCQGDICLGDRAYNVTRDSREVEIAGFEAGGKFLLRFLDTGAVGGNWDRSDLALQRGCSSDLCVGDQGYNVTRDSRQVQVAGIQYDGKLVLRFLDTNAVGGGWDRSDIAIARGCTGYICVGARAYNVTRDSREVEVAAISVDGKMVLRFLDTNAVGGGWDNTDLALQQGCGATLCVGQMARNSSRDYRQVQVVGISYDRKYVLRFLDTNAVGGGWEDSDLVRTNY